jgi:hypothetical protein
MSPAIPGQFIAPMHALIEEEICCPYCGEMITILVDPSVPEQTYIEDCQVCCRPIVVTSYIDGEDQATVSVRQEDE